MSLPPPAEIKGKFFVVATLVAQPGKADELQQHLANVRAVAQSDQEPDTLKYHTLRGVGAESDNFKVVEEYASQAALKKHGQSKAFQKFMQSGTVKDFEIKYLKEFSQTLLASL